MTAFGIIAGLVLTWAWCSPASVGYRLADVTKAYRSEFEGDQ